jgi:AcrR family transcriptional regulator
VRRADRVARILEAGAAVLGAKGPWGATMREVARASGTSLAGLYRHVSGREDLLYRVQVRLLQASVASAEAALAVPKARERLRALVTDHIRRVLACPAEAEVLRASAGPLRGARARRVDELRRRYLQLVGAAIGAAGPLRRGGRARKAGAAGPSGDARTALLLGMADRLALEGRLERPPPRPEDLARPVLACFLEGFARTPAGIP